MAVISYGAAQGVQSLKAQALARMKAKDAKYVLRCGNKWLHWSGEMLTDDRSQAWSGTWDQGEACRRSFEAAALCRLVSVAAITPVLNTETMQ